MATKNKIKTLDVDKEKMSRIGSGSTKYEKIGSMNAQREAANKIMGNATGFSDYNAKRNAVRIDPISSYSGHQNPKGLAARTPKRGDRHGGPLKNGFTMPNAEKSGLAQNYNVRRGSALNDVQRASLDTRELKTAKSLVKKDTTAAQKAYNNKMATRRAAPAAAVKGVGALATAYAVGQEVGRAYVAGRQMLSDRANTKEADRLGELAKKKAKK